LQDQTSESQGIFAGIITSIGSILEAAGEGSSKVMEALGKGIKSAAERAGILSKDVYPVPAMR